MASSADSFSQLGLILSKERKKQEASLLVELREKGKVIISFFFNGTINPWRARDDIY